MKTLSMGSELAREKLGVFHLGPNWIKKFDVYSAAELMGSARMSSSDEQEYRWSWQVEELEYRFCVTSHRGKEEFTEFVIAYPQSECELFRVEMRKGVLYVKSAAEWIDLWYLMAKDIVGSVGFAEQEVRKGTVAGAKKDFEKARGLMMAVVDNRCTYFEARDEDAPRFEPETGLMALWVLNEDFRKACLAETQKDVYMIMRNIRPAWHPRIPRTKYFVMANRTVTHRIVDPEDEVWSELIEVASRSPIWDKASTKFFRRACPLFDLPQKVRPQKTRANNIMIRFGDMYLHQLGSGQRQIARLILEIGLVIDYHARMPKGAVPWHRMFIVEEPEVSLHPNAQTRIMDLLLVALDVFESIGCKSHFVIETHSEYLFRRLQVGVKKSEIARDDVSVTIVDGTEGGMVTRNAQLNEDGSLRDGLPKGFLDEASSLIQSFHMG